MAKPYQQVLVQPLVKYILPLKKPRKWVKVAKVKENMLKNADTDAKSNGHWMDVIDEYIWTGVDLQTDYKKVVNELTPEKIAAFLKQLVDSGNLIDVVMTPEK